SSARTSVPSRASTTYTAVPPQAATTSPRGLGAIPRSPAIGSAVHTTRAWSRFQRRIVPSPRSTNRSCPSFAYATCAGSAPAGSLADVVIIQGRLPTGMLSEISSAAGCCHISAATAHASIPPPSAENDRLIVVDEHPIVQVKAYGSCEHHFLEVAALP